MVICDFDLGAAKTGLDLLRIAELAQPDTKRILMSGRPKSDVFVDPVDEDIHWLSKPIDVAQLFQTLRESLVQIKPVSYSK